MTPHTRPPADADAEHVLVRVVECLDGWVEVELVCEPAFDYGRVPATWSLVDEDGHAADASGAGQAFRLRTDLSLGIEGSAVRGRHRLVKGERAFCRAVLGRRPGHPRRCRRRRVAHRRHGPVLARRGWRGRASLTTRCGTRWSGRR